MHIRHRSARSWSFRHCRGRLQAGDLKTLRDIALAGDDGPVPVAQRPWFQEALAEPDRRRALGLPARITTAIQGRSVDVHGVLGAAATSDKELRGLWRAGEDERRGGATIIVDDLLHKSRLKSGLDRTVAIGIVWALHLPRHVFGARAHPAVVSPPLRELARRHAVRPAPAARPGAIRVMTCRPAPESMTVEPVLSAPHSYSSPPPTRGTSPASPRFGSDAPARGTANAGAHHPGGDQRCIDGPVNHFGYRWMVAPLLGGLTPSSCT
jgi:hypothetical protein